MDAIPHDVARQLHAAGELPGFAEPRPVVSVFPSLTDVAVPSLLRGVFSQRPPGYESRYLHHPSGEIRGPGDPEREAAFAPLRARPRGMWALAAIYLLRGPLASAQIRWITHRFRNEGGPWLGYLSATDGVAHFDGREGLVRAFREIAAAVHAARLDHQREHGVLPDAVLCSDHGMAFGCEDHLPARELGERLTNAGFQLGGRGPDAAVLVPYGDVGAGAVHVAPRRAIEAAEVVARAPGVELAFARVGESDDDSGFVVLGDAGAARARVDFRDGRYRYTPESGDPLDYGPVQAALAREGRLRDGWVDDADLFRATWSHRFPDALPRVCHGLRDLVLYPAAVLFSMRDTWTYGPALTHAGARLLGGVTGNHGGLSAAQSVGFAAVAQADGKDDPWPGAPALRPEEVFRPWADLVRAGSAESRGG